MTGDNSAVPPKSGLVLLLAAGAGLILAVGALLRPQQRAAELPISLTEGATLRALSQRDELREMADFLRDRAGAAARHLVYLPAHRSSGLVWGPARTVIIAGSDEAPLRTVDLPAGDSGAPALAAAPDRLTRRGWVLVAGRQADGSVTWSVGTNGGMAPVPCGGSEYRQLVLSVPLSAPFLAAGVFDLDGNLLGIVARCGQSYAALAVTDVPRVLATPKVPGREVGLRLRALDSLARRYFGADTGVLVTGVQLGSPAGQAGLRPGDVIAALDGVPVRTPEDAARSLQPDSQPSAITVVRRGAIRRLTLLTAGSPGFSITPPAEGLELAAVAPGSRADRAGLRPGDRIVQVGFLTRLTPAAARRAVEGARGPVYLVFRRDDEERGVFLP